MKFSFFKVVFSIFIFSLVSQVFSDTTHEVQSGDTLYSISKKYGVSVSAIQEANGMSDNAIKLGQKLKIPDGIKTSAPTQTAKSDSKAASPKSTNATSATTAPKTSFIVISVASRGDLPS